MILEKWLFFPHPFRRIQRHRRLIPQLIHVARVIWPWPLPVDLEDSGSSKGTQKRLPVDIQHGVMIEVNLDRCQWNWEAMLEKMWEKPKRAWHQPRVDSSHFQKTLFVFSRFYVFPTFFYVFLMFVCIDKPCP